MTSVTCISKTRDPTSNQSAFYLASCGPLYSRLSLFGQHHQIVIVCEYIVLTAFKRKQSKVGRTSLEGSSSHLSSAISNRNITFNQQRKTQTRTLSRVMILRQASQYIQELRSNFEIRGREVGGHL